MKGAGGEAFPRLFFRPASPRKSHVRTVCWRRGQSGDPAAWEPIFMTFLRFLAAPAAAAALAATAAPAAAQRRAAPPSFVVGAENGFIVPVKVNGHMLRLRLDTGVGRIILNPSAATAAGIRPSMFAAQAQIGPVRIRGNTSLKRIELGGWRATRRVVWFERDVVEGADGLIAVGMLPFASTTLRIRAATAADRPVVLPVEADDSGGLLYRHPVGGEQVRFNFRLWMPTSLATASAGAHLAEHHNGSWAGEPVERPLWLGVVRPVRPVRFASPVTLGGGFAIESLQVRTGDFRGNYVLPTDAPAAEADPDEIVVTANVGRGRAILNTSLGYDRLGRCASLVYSRRTKTLTLTCPA
jgi:hypothetical protein